MIFIGEPHSKYCNDSLFFVGMLSEKKVLSASAKDLTLR